MGKNITNNQMQEEIWISTVASRLKEVRKTCKLTQLKMAEKLGVSTKTVKNYENQETTPHIEIIRQYCDIGRVSADYLLAIGKSETAVSKFMSLPPDKQERLIKIAEDAWDK